MIPPDLRSTISVAVGVSIPLELVSSRSSSPSKAEYVSSPARFEDGLRIFEQPGSSEGEHAELDGLITSHAPPKGKLWGASSLVDPHLQATNDREST